jgi:hypothetical protein
LVAEACELMNIARVGGLVEQEAATSARDMVRAFEGR